MAATGAVRIDPGNEFQLRAWDGDEGAFWAANADRFDASAAGHHRALMAAAAIASGEHVLDIGCGTGQATRDAARAAGDDGSALGVDLSSAMLAVARDRAAAQGVANATFLQADAQVHPFAAHTFDVVISRTGAMFFAEPVAAFANIARAMRSGGRMVLCVWQPLADNEWIREIITALAAGRDMSGPPVSAPGPFGMADPAHARAVLESAGLVDVGFEGVQAPMRFGADATEAEAFILGVSGWMLEGLDDSGRAAALAALRNSLAGHTNPEGVTYDSATWLITARRP